MLDWYPLWPLEPSLDMLFYCRTQLAADSELLARVNAVYTRLRLYEAVLKVPQRRPRAWASYSGTQLARTLSLTLDDGASLWSQTTSSGQHPLENVAGPRHGLQDRRGQCRPEPPERGDGSF